MLSGLASYDLDFRINSYPFRVYSGKGALANLPSEVRRQRAGRAYIICGRSVSRKTGLIGSLRAMLGASCVGVYDEMGKDTPLPDVLAARDGARAAGADLLIAVGAGSVIQGVRIVAILLAEKGAPEELMTQYPDDGGYAISPKLLAPKLPIINIVTAATGAQNRAGSPAKVQGLDHRMEFFDPKTRPVAVFWDADALLTAPVSMMHSTGAAILWKAAMNMGYTHENPLVDFNRRQMFALVCNALPRLKDPDDAAPRIELCVASFMGNRQADDGGSRVNHWVARVVYAFAAALFNLHEHVGQGEANSALTPTVMRRLGCRDPEAMCRIAEALGVWRPGDPASEAHLRAADDLQKRFSALGMPSSLSELNIPRESADRIVENSLKTFNVDPKRELVRERGLLLETLIAAW